MTKQIFFILAVLCTLQAQASVRPIQVDTVQHTPYYDVSEKLQPIQPVYLMEWYFRHPGLATGLSALPGVRPPFSAHLSAAKTSSDA